MSSNNYSFSSNSYSYSSSTSDGQTTGQAASQHVKSDRDGTTVSRSAQNLGEAPQHQTRHFDAHGRELVGGTDTTNRITDAEQAERDRLYEERIEDEYAKREGGA